jgi:hypothetical protein
VTKLKQDIPHEGRLSEAIKSWVMVFLTLVFVVLYGLALIGKLRPLADASMVTRLEPLIFVIIGYYFGRLPSAENEQILKDEIGRQTQRADAAQSAKENALQSREALEEKVKNARAALAIGAPSPANGSGGGYENPSSPASGRDSVLAALNILNP